MALCPTLSNSSDSSPEGVGKSTIVTSLIKESFVAHVQHVVPEVTIPPEVTPENVTTYIVDSGVILVGNKIDLRGGQVTNEALEDEIVPIMNEFKEVETCVECSAKTPLNVSEVFYFAQKAVLHPTAPLYDSRDHVLKSDCVAALKRIFKLCDANKDGILDAAELNEFQSKCFDAPLQLQELEGIKEMVQEHTEDGVRDGGLTEAGFLFDVPSDCSVELSPLGYQFFTDIFETFDKDQDGALKKTELDEVFSTADTGNPWASQNFPDTTLSDDTDHKTTLAYLAYLGYPDEPRTDALQVTRARKIDRRKGKVTRNVFLAYIIGAAGSGKTSLLRSFAGKPFVETSDSASKKLYEPTSKVISVVNAVDIDGSEKYLVLQEFGSRYEAETLRNSKRTDNIDVIVYVHDSSDTNSFSYISNLRQQYSLDHIPTLFVATKSDLDLALQRHEVQPDVYCRRLGLQVPVAVSVKTGQTADVFHAICDVAMNPHSAIPGGADRAMTAAARLRIYNHEQTPLRRELPRVQVLTPPIGVNLNHFNNPAAVILSQNMDEDMDFGSSAPHEFVSDQQYAPQLAGSPDDGHKTLDLVFIQDCTGSQGSYITSATKNIEQICAHIFESGKLQRTEDLRVGLVAFRDHPPQDHTYIVKNFGFSSDISKVKNDLSGLYASGGGDGPEAVTAAMAEALNMDWREYSSKMVVLIADAPPHGIGEYGDGFDDGSPDGFDPLQLARQMASRGIPLYANDFYRAVTNITSGLMLPLTTADLLANAIVGSVLENLDMERLVREVGHAVAERILGNNESVDDVARELHERLLLRNESTKKVVIESIYRESDEATHNVNVFTQAPSLAEARPLLKRVHGTRFTDKYLAARSSLGRASYSVGRGYTPSYPSPPKPVSPTKATAPSSPPRKVVQDFAAFGAPKSASVFGTAVASTPFSLAGGKAAFGGIRGGAPRSSYDDDDEDEDDGRQRVELRESSISLDQARRIAMQSAWRGVNA
ncbi:hypothetical protein H0H87_008711 [Tephrocybe sp. NHM501043]|nr:hypothetical protein H0H87_008711 [Tephrocybe sp. NHM501043]